MSNWHGYCYYVHLGTKLFPMAHKGKRPELDAGLFQGSLKKEVVALDWSKSCINNKEELKWLIQNIQ